MDFAFTEEQELFRKSVRAFCEKQLVPRINEIDEEEEIPHEIIEDMGALGLLGIAISKEYGGSEGGFFRAAIAAEEIARADISMATAVYYLVETGWGFLLDRYGSTRAKEEILPDVVKGKTFLGIASTEAAGGSDIVSLTTAMARRDDRKLCSTQAPRFSHGDSAVTVVVIRHLYI